MPFEHIYYFNGIARWNLGFISPNYAAALIAMLIPCFWAWSPGWHRWWRAAASLLLLGGEACLWYVLCRTYSRGGLVGVFVALLLWIMMRLLLSRDARWSSLALFVARVAIVVVLVNATGFAGRMEPARLQTDRAVGNRLELWRGGMSMVAGAPLQGWGGGESGRSYMNWFQELDRDEQYSTAVNSYLSVAIDYGLGTLLLIVAALVWLGGLSGGAARAQCWPVATLYVSMVAWAGCNFFTTLWREPKLWILPVLAAIALVGWSWRRPDIRWRRIFLACGVMGVSASLATWALGAWFAAKRDQSVQVQGLDRLIVLRPNQIPETSQGLKYELWPDPEIFGSFAGRELRLVLGLVPAGVSLLVHPLLNNHELIDHSGVERVLLFGRYASRLAQARLSLGQSVWIVHPSVAPPEEPVVNLAPDKMRIFLPEIDASGLNGAWATWAGKNQITVQYTPQSGLDIRAAWPAQAADLLGAKP